MSEQSDDLSVLAERAQEATAQLVELSGMEAEVVVTENAERILVDVRPADPEDGRILIGSHGRTLSAYQLIVNRMVNRSADERKPVALDVSGFTEQRRDRLEKLAVRLADVVRERRLELSIAGMNPADRRTVHLALTEAHGVRTYSEDMGIARRLVITPAGRG